MGNLQGEDLWWLFSHKTLFKKSLNHSRNENVHKLTGYIHLWKRQINKISDLEKSVTSRHVLWRMEITTRDWKTLYRVCYPLSTHKHAAEETVRHSRSGRFERLFWAVSTVWCTAVWLIDGLNDWLISCISMAYSKSAQPSWFYKRPQMQHMPIFHHISFQCRSSQLHLKQKLSVFSDNVSKLGK